VLPIRLTIVQGDPETAHEENGTWLLLSPAISPSKERLLWPAPLASSGVRFWKDCLRTRGVQSVHALSRRKPRVAHARITGHIVDFAALPPLPPVDEVYLALGTTIKVAGSQAAFRTIDFDADLAVARAALAAGARRCGLVSAVGANAKSSVFYNRVKGELEEALTQLPFEGLVIAWPPLLVGKRASLGQPERPLEKVSAVFMKIFGPVIPANYRAIEATKVARTLLARTPAAEGRVVVLSGEMRRG
jgi:uncharacterized protein YbjT (DUF2867 family)